MNYVPNEFYQTDSLSQNIPVESSSNNNGTLFNAMELPPINDYTTGFDYDSFLQPNPPAQNTTDDGDSFMDTLPGSDNFASPPNTSAFLNTAHSAHASNRNRTNDHVPTNNVSAIPAQYAQRQYPHVSFPNQHTNANGDDEIVGTPFEPLIDLLDNEAKMNLLKAFRVDYHRPWAVSSFEDLVQMFRTLINNKTIKGLCREQWREFMKFIAWYNRINKYLKNGTLLKLSEKVKQIQTPPTYARERNLGEFNFIRLFNNNAGIFHSLNDQEVYVLQTMAYANVQLESFVTIIRSVSIKMFQNEELLLREKRACDSPLCEFLDPHFLYIILMNMNNCRMTLAKSMIAFMGKACGGLCPSTGVKQFVSTLCDENQHYAS